MVNVTIAVPEDLKKKMDARPEMNWSEIARQAWGKKIETLNCLDELTADVDISDEEILRISRKINQTAARRHDEDFKRWKARQTKSAKSAVE